MRSINNTILTIVVSVFNEEQVLTLFYGELTKVLATLDINHEIIFVNDGSHDNSLKILSEYVLQNKHVKVVNFSKNFGHEAAMIAGIDYSAGDAVICMDADLQHPPEKIKEMLEKYLNDFEIINMVRTENCDAGFLKRMLSKSFYYLINKISPIRFEPNASDYFLISSRVASILKHEFRERTRFLRGFIQIVGFRTTTLDFVAPKRAGGESKYSFLKLFKLSLSAIAAFSNLPLRLGIIAGVSAGLFGIVEIIYSVFMKILGAAPPGYTTIVVLVSFMFAIQFFIIGIIGEYLGFIFAENKQRPIYIIEDLIHNETIAERK